MKFLVTRTSDYSDETQPVEEARLVETIHIDRRTVKTLEEAKTHIGELTFLLQAKTIEKKMEW